MYAIPRGSPPLPYPLGLAVRSWKGHGEKKRSKPTGGQRGGSKPVAPQGLQRTTRHNVRTAPLDAPYLLKDSLEYSEHVGTNRHDLGKRGEMMLL